MSLTAKCAGGVLLAACASSAVAQNDVPPELWDRPRTAAAIVGQDSVKRAVATLIKKREAQLVIHHAAGQEPLSQAEELKSWLTALAIDSRRIVLRSGLPTGAPIRLEVIE